MRYMALAAPLLVLTLTGCETLMGPKFLLQGEVNVVSELKNEYYDFTVDINKMRDPNEPARVAYWIESKAIDSTKNSFSFGPASEQPLMLEHLKNSTHRNLKPSRDHLKGSHYSYSFITTAQEKKTVDRNGNYIYKNRLELSSMQNDFLVSEGLTATSILNTPCANEAYIRNIAFRNLAALMDKALKEGGSDHSYSVDLKWSSDKEVRKKQEELCNRSTSAFKRP